MNPRAARRLGAVLVPLLAAGANAAEFRSVADSAAVLYDAPSAKATKLYVVGRSYPLEIVVGLGGWTKIRDAGGEQSEDGKTQGGPHVRSR